MTNRSTSIEQATEFFYRYAGWSYDPRIETPEQGRRAGARALAEAEQLADARGWTTWWDEDWEVNHAKECPEMYADGGPETCERAMLCDSAGQILATLSCIDDADGNYRRVVAAELALEAAKSV